METRLQAQFVTQMMDGDTIVMAGVGTIPIVTATAIRVFYPATMKTTVMKAKTVRRAVVLALAMWGVMLAAWISVEPLL